MGLSTRASKLARILLLVRERSSCVDRPIDNPMRTTAMMTRRHFIVIAAAAGSAPTIAHGQDAWPQRPVTVIVPFGAGGSADLVARLFAQGLQAKYGVSVVVENRGGAGGSIGAGAVAKAPADGYTLLLGTVST